MISTWNTPGILLCNQALMLSHMLLGAKHCMMERARTGSRINYLKKDKKKEEEEKEEESYINPIP